jgi:predicted nucleic acid-binding protein
MVLVDVNLLINAIHSASPDHVAAKAWLDGRLQGGEPIGLSWAVLVGFVRITTNPRIMSHPFTLDESLQQVRYWWRCRECKSFIPRQNTNGISRNCVAPRTQWAISSPMRTLRRSPSSTNAN